MQSIFIHGTEHQIELHEYYIIHSHLIRDTLKKKKKSGLLWYSLSFILAAGFFHLTLKK